MHTATAVIIIVLIVVKSIGRTTHNDYAELIMNVVNGSVSLSHIVVARIHRVDTISTAVTLTHTVDLSKCLKYGLDIFVTNWLLPEVR